MNIFKQHFKYLKTAFKRTYVDRSHIVVGDQINIFTESSLFQK